MKLFQFYYKYRWVLFLIIISTFLNTYQLSRLEFGNTYYAAAIKSMTESFRNFFFVSFDSTGFISVDKAPLSLWVDTFFAKMFGFSGIAILFPHVLEGILVSVLTFVLLQKVFKKHIAFIGGLVMALSPVNVAVYRNNTPDALLLVFLLATLIFFVDYLKSSNLTYLILSAVMLGLGFNTKMLQAFLIIPALIGSLIIFNKVVKKRIIHTGLFSIITLLVSFSWITIVDLTPPSLRPYVGGSENNSAWNLAFSYNGTQRLLGENGIGGNPGFNVGEKGLTRLFTGEMGTQTGWLLVPAMMFLFYFLGTHSRQFFQLNRLSELSLRQKFVLISGIYIVTQFIFFSYASFFHSYYLNMFALPIAFLFAYGISEIQKRKILIGVLMSGIPLQWHLINESNYARILLYFIVFGALISLLLYFKKFSISLTVSLTVLFAAPAVWSYYTTVYGNTATPIFIGGPSVQGENGFRARDGNGFDNATDEVRPMPPNRDDGRFPQIDSNHGMQSITPQMNSRDGAPAQGAFGSQSVSADVLNYLIENYSNQKYFVGVTSQSEATGFILDESIGNIMTLGGFSGRDQAITLEGLQQKIADHEIRFFLLSNRGLSGQPSQLEGPIINDNNRFVGNRQIRGGMFNANEDITEWIVGNCTRTEVSSNLYDCQM